VKVNPFNRDNAFVDWDAIHYETVCMVIVEGCVDTNEIAEHMLQALCQSGVLGEGDSFNFTKTGNTIIIGKAQANISLDSGDTIN